MSNEYAIRRCRHCDVELTDDNARRDMRPGRGNFVGACRSCESATRSKRVTGASWMTIQPEIAEALKAASVEHDMSMAFLGNALIKEGLARLIPAEEFRLTRPNAAQS